MAKIKELELTDTPDRHFLTVVLPGSSVRVSFAAILAANLAGCAPSKTGEPGSRVIPGRADNGETELEGAALVKPDNICIVTGRSFAATLENIPPDRCTTQLIYPGGTEVNPDAIAEARVVLRERLQKEAQDAIAATEFQQQLRAEAAIALANAPTPTPTSVPTRIVVQEIPTPAKLIPGDEGFVSKYFNAPIPTETPSPEKLAAQVALEAALARGPEIGFGPTPTADAQADSTMSTLRSQSEPAPTTQSVAENTVQVQDPLAPTVVLSDEKPLSEAVKAVVDVASQVQEDNMEFTWWGLQSADTVILPSLPAQATEQPSVDVPSDGAGWANIFLSPEFAIPVIFCVVIPGSLMGIFAIYLSKSKASNEEILQNGMKKLSGKK